MTQVQHTAGPWKAEIWDYAKATPPRKELQIESSTNLLATLQCDFSGNNPFTIPQAEAEANARVMALAPEMLAWIQEVCTNGISIHDVKIGKALIARATNAETVKG